MSENQPAYLTEWLPYKTERRYERPRSATWADQGPVVPEYAKLLGEIGLANPRPKAVEFYATAIRLRDAAEQQPVEAKRDDTTERLASGELLLDEAGKMLIKRPTMREAEDRAREYRESLTAASCTALLNSIMQIHDVGEIGWLKLLRPIAADAIAKLDQRRWDAVHALAELLREPTRRKVFGLAAAMLDHTISAAPSFYRFGNPRLVYLWQVTNARGHQVREISTRPIDGMFRVAFDTTQAPLPTVRDFEPSWQPGLYSAQESIDNTIRGLDEQEAEFAPPESAGPGPQKRGRAMIS
jgi:hypothetical protein